MGPSHFSFPAVAACDWAMSSDGSSPVPALELQPPAPHAVSAHRTPFPLDLYPYRPPHGNPRVVERSSQHAGKFVGHPRSRDRPSGIGEGDWSGHITDHGEYLLLCSLQGLKPPAFGVRAHSSPKYHTSQHSQRAHVCRLAEIKHSWVFAIWGALAASRQRVAISTPEAWSLKTLPEFPEQWLTRGSSLHCVILCQGAQVVPNRSSWDPACIERLQKEGAGLAPFILSH